MEKNKNLRIVSRHPSEWISLQEKIRLRIRCGFGIAGKECGKPIKVIDKGWRSLCEGCAWEFSRWGTD